MLLERLKNEVLVFDGAMGSQIQAAGLKAGEIPELLNITNPQLIIDIHKRYIKAGANFITTNTFGCNPLKMKDLPYSFEEILQNGINNAIKAKDESQSDAYIALDIGPIGQLIEPMGTLKFDEAYELVKKQIEIAKDQVDLVILETMSDIYEVKSAVLAIKENSDLPIFVTMTFEKNKRTLSGCDVATLVNVLEGLNVDAIGVNCSLGPIELTPIIDELLSTATLPVIVQPNAGLPCLVEGKTCYTMEKEEFVNACLKHVHNGVSIIGGCCGTTPDFIQLLKEQLPQKTYLHNPYECKVSSGVKTKVIDDGVTICGERLNPTGKKKLKQAIIDQKYDELMLEAIHQKEAGAHVLDVNVGVAGIDECEVMVHVVKMLQEVIDLPLQIDSSDKETIEKACRYYNGKPLINSVNGKDSTMDAIFPIVKKYGGVCIGLTLDENGIPSSCEERFEIAKKIIHKASTYGIRKEDIIIDCLVLTASAQQAEVKETIKAVQMVKTLGVKTVLGCSNVSFGLPNRPLLNKTFIAMALSAGLNIPIVNPMDQELMATIDAFNVLNNNDKDAKIYIEKQTNAIVNKVENKAFTLEDIIFHGLKDEVEKATQTLLETKQPLEVVNEILIPALDKVGQQYEKNIIFLPQLIQSAETSKIAFDEIKKTFTDQQASKGPIIMATVEGDVHDIGKNIVKVVLESYGYKVIDLGKDVPIHEVVEAFHKYQPKAIGLSALMTTTVKSMEATIIELRKIEDMCPILVGGAVMSYETAKQINADYYTKDAMECVELLNKIIR